MRDASEFNYTVSEHCDTCNKDREGTMYHHNDAMGIATPVLWTCHYCANPPALVGLYRRTKNLAKRKWNRAMYIATTPKAERDARRAHRLASVARINARRAAEGRPLIKWGGIPGTDC